MSDTFPPKLAAALVKVSASVKMLGKTEKNTFAKYDFVSVDKFYATIGALMAENGLHCIPDCIESEVQPGHVKQKGTERVQGAPLLREKWAFLLVHESGECVGPFHRVVTVPAEGAQAHGSSESYAQKQFLRGVFRVPTGDKDDPDWGEAQTHSAASVTAKAAKGSAQAFDLSGWEQRIDAAREAGGVALKEVGDEIAAAVTAGHIPPDFRTHLRNRWAEAKRSLMEEASHEAA